MFQTPFQGPGIDGYFEPTGGGESVPLQGENNRQLQDIGRARAIGDNIPRVFHHRAGLPRSMGRSSDQNHGSRPCWTRGR